MDLLQMLRSKLTLTLASLIGVAGGVGCGLAGAIYAIDVLKPLPNETKVSLLMVPALLFLLALVSFHCSSILSPDGMPLSRLVDLGERLTFSGTGLLFAAVIKFTKENFLLLYNPDLGLVFLLPPQQWLEALLFLPLLIVSLVSSSAAAVTVFQLLLFLTGRSLEVLIRKGSFRFYLWRRQKSR